MASNLIEAVESRLTPDVVGKLANAIGETPAKTSNAVSSMVPAAFAGLIQKGSSESGVNQLLTGLKDFQAAQTFGEPSDPKGIMAKGNRLASGILGSSGGRIADVVARSSGVRKESSTSILSFVFPMIAGVLGKQALTRGLGAAGLSELLSSQRKAVFDHPNLPSGLSESLGLSDLSQLGGIGAEVPEPHVSVGRAVSRAPTPLGSLEGRFASGSSRTPWGAIAGALGIGALIIAGLVYFTRGARHGEVGTMEPEAPVTRAPEAVLPTAPRTIPPPEPNAPREPSSETTTTGANVEKPAGTDETGEGSSTETTAGTMAPSDENADDQGAKTDESTAKPLVEGDIATHFAKTTGALPERIALPNVNFDVGSAEPMEGSESSIDSLAESMKAHPSAKIRLEGYTDATGGNDVNARLSHDRAKSVKDMLVAKGIDASRIDIVGRSERSPVADNDSSDGRQQNRRVDALLLSR